MSTEELNCLRPAVKVQTPPETSASQLKLGFVVFLARRGVVGIEIEVGEHLGQRLPLFFTFPTSILDVEM
jgi:hypothetical protein